MGDSESIQLYRPGGYHPVQLADKFNNNRYVVEHKLGHGGCSTIWLARDLHLKRLVALKIFASILECDASATTEALVLRRLHPQPWLWPFGSPSSSSRIEFFPTLLDEFIINGPNGSHRCIVTEALGPSLSEFLDEDVRDGRLPIQLARRIGVQLAQAVAEMHARGIVHGGMSSIPIAVHQSSVQRKCAVEDI
ncbi:kinase-like protein [Wilcoxina mikolae CBS 423.85]|nr:kinase-like protein [Wilcoxina mikolae CBS 423.85]